MALTRQEYEELLTRRESGDIYFMYDIVQSKEFLLRLNNDEALSSIGNSLRFQSNIIRAIVYFLEPLTFLGSLLGSILWLKWWGIPLALGIIFCWGLLKITSSCGRQKILIPSIITALGLFSAYYFREQGSGFLVFAVSFSFLYFFEKMLYALPVLFFSLLTRSNYDFVKSTYQNPADEFSQEIGAPMMWHVEREKNQDKVFDNGDNPRRQLSKKQVPQSNIKSGKEENELSLHEKAEEAPFALRILMEIFQVKMENENNQILLLPGWQHFITISTIGGCVSLALRLHFDVPEEDRTTLELKMREHLQFRSPQSDQLYEDCSRFVSESLSDIPRSERFNHMFRIIAKWVIVYVSQEMEIENQEDIIGRLAFVYMNETSGYWKPS